jgi:hypothetical protein
MYLCISFEFPSFGFEFRGPSSLRFSGFKQLETRNSKLETLSYHFIRSISSTQIVSRLR